MSTRGKILAVIPCLNEEAHLERLVRGLLRDNADLPMTIVIADGGSTDRSVEIAKALAQESASVVYLHNPNKIQSAAVNLAVAALGADAEFLLRLDAHADYPADYARRLLEEQAATGAASVVVAMQTGGTGCFQRAAAAAQNSLLGNGGSAHRKAGGAGAWVDHGHHALMRIDAFRATGGYDAGFTHNEDAELDVRLGKAGHKIWLTGKTVMTYYPRETPVALLRQYFRFGKGRARTVMKHKLIPKLRRLAPVAVAPAAALLLVTPFLAIAALPFAAWALLCLGYGLLLGLRARSLCAGFAGFAAMVMHLGWSFGFWKGILAKT
jgi:succinoglycan biosynthesis protein ExoA